MTPPQSMMAVPPPYGEAFASQGKNSRPRSVLAIAALGTAVVAAVMGGVALVRSAYPPRATAVNQSTTPTHAPIASTDQVSAAKKEACDAWAAAASAINAARHAFVVAPTNWDDPITANALAQAEAAIAIQVTYVRQHVPNATPPDVAAPIGEYLAAAIDTAAADGQHQDDAVSNAAAERSAVAAKKIKAACG